jgi:hypothetical protein
MFLSIATLPQNRTIILSYTNVITINKNNQVFGDHPYGPPRKSIGDDRGPLAPTFVVPDPIYLPIGVFLRCKLAEVLAEVLAEMLAEVLAEVMAEVLAQVLVLEWAAHIHTFPDD